MSNEQNLKTEPELSFEERFKQTGQILEGKVKSKN